MFDTDAKAKKLPTDPENKVIGSVTLAGKINAKLTDVKTKCVTQMRKLNYSTDAKT